MIHLLTSRRKALVKLLEWVSNILLVANVKLLERVSNILLVDNVKLLLTILLYAICCSNILLVDNIKFDVDIKLSVYVIIHFFIILIYKNKIFYIYIEKI